MSRNTPSTLRTALGRGLFGGALALAVLAAAPAASAQVQAYLVDSDLDRLFAVDLNTGAATFIASTANNGLGTPADLVWRGDLGELWTVDLDGGEVGRIDTTTGVFTPVFQTGTGGWQGMAWDPTTQLYYLANQTGQTYVLDPATGGTSLLGPTGFSLVTALEVDGQGTLWGTDFNGAVVRFDKNTGAAVAVSSTVSSIQGLGIDAQTGRWYASNTNADSLFEVDPVSGSATLIGAHGAGVTFAKGFDIVDSTCSENYGAGCAGSGGFVPTLDLLGCATAGSVTAIHVQNALGGATAFLALGQTKGSLPMGGGCSLLVTPLFPFLPAFPLMGAGPGNGSQVVPGPVPAGVAGLSITMQIFVADPGTGTGFSSTNGLKIVFQ